MLALSDREGYVFASSAGLARQAGVSLVEVDEALAVLESPDPRSGDRKRHPERDGRRIEEVDGGWKLVNHAYYRGLQRAEDRRTQNREAKRRQRGRSANVSDCRPSESGSEADASPDRSYGAGAPPDLGSPPAVVREGEIRKETVPASRAMTDPPATLEVTQELRDQCAMAGARAPETADVIAYLANARARGHQSADWPAGLVVWMQRQKGFDQQAARREARQRPARNNPADIGYMQPPGYFKPEGWRAKMMSGKSPDEKE